jgi:transposase
MLEPIMVACDLHDKSMLLKIAQGRAQPMTRTFANTRAGRDKMLRELRCRSQAADQAPVIFAYEASGQGFGLYDELTAAGMECHVLAPTKIARSVQQGRQKTDEKDAELILELLRGHVLAGNRLPSVWIPDPQTRDDRELVRLRLDLAEKITALKAQVQCLLKRNNCRRSKDLGKGWTRKFYAWLAGLTSEGVLGAGARATLASLLRQLNFHQQETQRIEKQLVRLANQPRYQKAIQEMAQLAGVGVLTALVFLTEVGDLRRFANRRQISAYLGLVPSSHESGERNDRKGRITRQGPARVRRVLCQAAWSRVRCDGPDHDSYQRLVRKNPKRKKIAVVAVMRRLAVRMWHRGCRGAPGEYGSTCRAPAG